MPLCLDPYCYCLLSGFIKNCKALLIQNRVVVIFFPRLESINILSHSKVIRGAQKDYDGTFYLSILTVICNLFGQQLIATGLYSVFEVRFLFGLHFKINPVVLIFRKNIKSYFLAIVQNIGFCLGTMKAYLSYLFLRASSVILFAISSRPDNTALNIKSSVNVSLWNSFPFLSDISYLLLLPDFCKTEVFGEKEKDTADNCCVFEWKHSDWRGEY